MLIRCWGSRGSIAVSGKEYLKYGGDTTCIEITAKSGDKIIIDAGTGIRKLGHKLCAEGYGELNILFTHSHWDHISGFPFFKPVHLEKSKINIYGPHSANESIKTVLEKTLTAPFFPIELDDISSKLTFIDITKDNFTIGSITISTIALNHTNSGVGYKFTEDGKSFVFLTDNEIRHAHDGGPSKEEFIEFCKDADLFFHDSEFTEEDYVITKGWGHSVYSDSVEVAGKANVKTLGLFHHNQERTDDQVDEILKDSLKIIKDQGYNLECIAVSDKTEIEL